MRSTLSLASIPQDGGPWRALAIVSFSPNSSDVEPHAQTTDVLSFTLAGRGEWVSNGDACQLETGVMVSAPAGTSLTIANASALETLEMFVAEVAVPDGARDYPPSFCHLLQELHTSDHFHRVFNGTQRICPMMAEVKLQHAFAAPWGTFSLLVLPPGCRVEPFIEPDQDQVFLVMRGQATFILPTWRGSITEPNGLPETRQIATERQSYQSVFVPRGVPCGLLNQSGKNTPVFVVCLTVLRTNR